MKSSPRIRYQQTRTWYGLPVEIAVSSDNFHRVSMPGLAIPHPGLVNLIVRRGLPTDIRLELTARHELGHLQTLPLPLLHLLLLLWPGRQRLPRKRWLRFGAGLLSHQMVWEIAAEGYLTMTDRRAYRAPRALRFRALYAIFWAGMIIMSILSTLFVLDSKENVDV